MGSACSSACFAGLWGQRRSPKALREPALRDFKKLYGVGATALGIAPGRAEVLGNHTDYNEGFILSAAIDLYVVVAGRRSADGLTSRVASAAFPSTGPVAFSTAGPTKMSGDEAWANYVLGVVSELNKLGAYPGGFDAYISGNVPPGAAVSSSAALEMATAMLLVQLFPETVGKLDNLTIIKACKAAENNFVGMGCGILDQFSSGKGKAGNLIYLDCRSLEYSYVPFQGGEFLLANTNAPHQLVDGKYDELRRLCFQASDAFKAAKPDAKITHLRDVDVATFEKHAGALPTRTRKTSKHIVYENQRVQEAVEALRVGNLDKLGKAMSASHDSSRHDFENSCKELDAMIECSKGIDGLLGGRLMGGGFGGCTINLVKADCAKSVATELGRRYKEKTGMEGTMLICNTGDGAYGEAV